MSIQLDSLAEVALERGIGGWGNGANYSYHFRLRGDAEYEGGIRALLKGSYVATMDSSSLTALLNVIRRHRLQHSDDFCYDAPSATIRFILKNGSEVAVTAACGAPQENVELATQLDSLGSSLKWHSAEAAPPNKGLLQAGAAAGQALTRVGSSSVTSLTQVAASREGARCRTPSR